MYVGLVYQNALLIQWNCSRIESVLDSAAPGKPHAFQWTGCQGLYGGVVNTAFYMSKLIGTLLKVLNGSNWTLCGESLDICTNSWYDLFRYNLVLRLGKNSHFFLPWVFLCAHVCVYDLGKARSGWQRTGTIISRLQQGWEPAVNHVILCL